MMAAWDKLPAEALVELQQAMVKVTDLLWDALNEFPPITEANRPGRTSLATGKPMGFYEREAGWWYPIMRRETLGEKPSKRAGNMRIGQANRLFPTAGMGTYGVAGYKLRKVSEKLLESWDKEVTTTADAIVGAVGTDTSYAPWLVDDTKQARRMQAIGWVTVGDTMDAQEDAIYEVFEKAVDDVLKKFVSGS